MGWWNRGAYMGTPDTKAVGQLPDDQHYTRWEVVGVWINGALETPERVVVELEHPREPERSAEKVGDILNMTQAEAQVVGKHIALAPVR